MTIVPKRLDATADETPPFRSVGFMLSTVGYATARGFRAALAPLELEPREWAVLRSVAFAEGQSQQALGERLQIPPSRMVSVIDALEGRGFVERRMNPSDRRARALHLTPAGRRKIDEAFAAARDYELRLSSRLSAQQREELIDMLQVVADELGIPPGVHAAEQDETAEG